MAAEGLEGLLAEIVLDLARVLAGECFVNAEPGEEIRQRFMAGVNTVGNLHP